MFIRSLVQEDKFAVQALIGDSFSGFPWYAVHSQEELDGLWQSASAEHGFSGLVAIDECGAVIGGSWWHFPSPEAVRGDKLATFIQNARDTRVLVWEDAILVRQKYQRQGIGLVLRRTFIEEMRKISGGALILSRMRSDNIPSLLLAERLGFRRTGAQSKERDTPLLFQEFWYLLV